MPTQEQFTILWDAVVDTVTQQADDLCWLDVMQRLAGLVDVEFDPVLLPRAQMKAQCGRFIDSLYDGLPYDADRWTTALRDYEEVKAKLREAGFEPAGGAAAALDALLEKLS